MAVAVPTGSSDNEELQIKKVFWRKGARIPSWLKPETALMAFEAIRDANGGVCTPELVVDAASDPAHPLHGVFTWDVEAAAAKQWVREAYHVIGALKVIQVNRNGEESPPVRYLIKVQKRAGDGDLPADSVLRPKVYIPVMRAVSEADLRERMMEQALRDLRAWRQRYSHLLQYGDFHDRALTILSDDQP